MVYNTIFYSIHFVRGSMVYSNGIHARHMDLDGANRKIMIKMITKTYSMLLFAF